MSTSLAVKYRPQTFDNVIGQPYTVEVLTNQIKNGTVGKCYLYTGPSGVGKTTVARIFGKMIDGEIIEIDAASNNGVENVRNINDHVKFKPLTNAYKVYIIDECHMLSRGAWNALLKTLEEPPSFVVFILATTEPHKVPATILSRSQRFNFVKPLLHEIKSNLKHILTSEGKDVPEDITTYVCKLSDGGVRSSITMTEAILNMSGELTVERVYELLGQIPTSYFIEIVLAVVTQDGKGILEQINKYNNEGINFTRFTEQLCLFLLDLKKYILTRNMKYLNVSEQYEPEIRGILNTVVQLYDGDVDMLWKVIKHVHDELLDFYYKSYKLVPQQALLTSKLLQLAENRV